MAPVHKLRLRGTVSDRLHVLFWKSWHVFCVCGCVGVTAQDLLPILKIPEHAFDHMLQSRGLFQHTVYQLPSSHCFKHNAQHLLSNFHKFQTQLWYSLKNSSDPRSWMWAGGGFWPANTREMKSWLPSYAAAWRIFLSCLRCVFGEKLSYFCTSAMCSGIV